MQGGKPGGLEILEEKIRARHLQETLQEKFAAQDLAGALGFRKVLLRDDPEAGEGASPQFQLPALSRCQSGEERGFRTSILSCTAVSSWTKRRKLAHLIIPGTHGV